MPKYIGIIVGKLLRKDKFGVKSFILTIQDFVIKFWRCADGKESWFFFLGLMLLLVFIVVIKLEDAELILGITVA